MTVPQTPHLKGEINRLFYGLYTRTCTLKQSIDQCFYFENARTSTIDIRGYTIGKHVWHRNVLGCQKSFNFPLLQKEGGHVITEAITRLSAHYCSNENRPQKGRKRRALILITPEVRASIKCD